MGVSWHAGLGVTHPHSPVARPASLFLDSGCGVE